MSGDFEDIAIDPRSSMYLDTYKGGGEGVHVVGDIGGLCDRVSFKWYPV